VPDDASVAAKSVFCIDDVSLQAIEEPPLAVFTPLDEYYVGETISWSVATTSSGGPVKVQLWLRDRLIAEQTNQVDTGRLRGACDTAKLTPGIYTLQASVSSPQRTVQTAQRQILLAPDIFDSWKE